MREYISIIEEMEMSNYDKDIDIVIPWVDGNDPEWLAEKNYYQEKITGEEDIRVMRYREWDNLKYVFRSIEKNMGWIRKIHFLTWGHLPEWMDVDHPKLNIVNHKDFIPGEYLPTFSSHVIELNMHRIKGLCEHFIYFNDDIFVLKKLRPEHFFKKGIPCDANVQTIIIPTFNNFSAFVFHDIACINRHFNKRQFILKKPLKWINPVYGAPAFIRALMFTPWKDYTGFKNHHMAVPYCKSTLEEVWRQEEPILRNTCTHKFRDDEDVNQYIFRYWQLASGNFVPSPVLGKSYMASSENVNQIMQYVRKKKGKMVCINDGWLYDEFENVKDMINSSLDVVFPEKSSFEK